MQALSQLSYGPVTRRDGLIQIAIAPYPVLSMIPPENRYPLFRIMLVAPWATRRAQNPEHSSGSISSLLVAADVADDVGDVLVAFLFVGDEG